MAFAAAVRVNVSAPLWKSARDLLLKMSTEGVRSNLQSGHSSHNWAAQIGTNG